MGDQLGRGDRIARKRHTCTLCDLPIEPGELYHWWTIADAGSLWTGKAHQECDAALTWDATQSGCLWDLELPDPYEFRTEILSAYRKRVLT